MYIHISINQFYSKNTNNCFNLYFNVSIHSREILDKRSYAVYQLGRRFIQISTVYNDFF